MSIVNLVSLTHRFIIRDDPLGKFVKCNVIDMKIDSFDEFVAMLKKSKTALEQLGSYINWCIVKASGSTLRLLIAEFIAREKSQEHFERLTEIMTPKYANSQIINEILLRGVNDGEFPKIDCQIVAELFYSLCEGIVFRYYMFHRDIELLRKAFKEAERIFINSVILQQSGS